MKERAGKEDVLRRVTSKGIFPHQYAFTLLIPFRNIFLSPKGLIRRLELKDDMRVMEVGPGPGYFSIPVARRLKQGSLVLADIQQEMLDYAKKRIEKKGLSNVEYYLCSGDSFGFEKNSFDRIYLITVIGEVEKKEVYFKDFHRMLKPGGLLSISELAGDPDKMTPDELRNLAEPVGFKFLKLFGTDRNYTVNFAK